MKYPHRILLTKVRILSSDEAALHKKIVGNMPQCGIRNIEDSVYLQSNSAQDIFEVPVRKYWEHTTRPRDIAKGTTVYILPSKPEIVRMNGVVFGIVATAATEAFLADPATYVIWPSEA